ncbi:phosphoribosylaminoimidazolesuccinocarboxamide synthase [Betaproteobacteria bacterium SCN2]|nr:phosphoribosylaminoimidazolesuccinocarboxamide synthase [Betaproteobacteria bacterium SCN2]
MLNRSDNLPWLALATLLLAGGLVYLLAPVLTPFLAGVLLAYIFDPLVDRLQKRGLNRTLATFVVLIAAGLLAVGAVLMVIPMFLNQAQLLIDRLPDYLGWIQLEVLPTLTGLFGVTADIDMDTVRNWVAEHAQSAGSAAQQFLPRLGSGASALLAAAINLLLVPVVTFYLLRDWDGLVRKVDELIPRPWHEQIARIARDVDRVLSEFLRGQLSVMLAMSVFYSVGLSLAGLEFALPIGIITGVLGFIPFVGATLGLVLGVLEATLQFQSVTGVLPVLGVFILGQALEGMVVTPYLVGDRIGLHPVAVIFALAAFGQVFGFFGVLLALPMAAALLVAIRHLREAYVNSPVYAGMSINPESSGRYNPGFHPAASAMPALLETSIKSLPLISKGKVRDIYAVDDKRLLMVTTDRLSAFDVIMPTPIPDKGAILTDITKFWFEKLAGILPNQLTGDAPESVVAADEREQVAGRALVVKRLKPLPVEAIVRGYLVGSGWKEYQEKGSVCGIALPAGLKQAGKLPQALFTPSTKAELGEHDENIDFARCEVILGKELAAQVRDASLALYTKAAEYALTKGIIIADTKFEFGLDASGALHLIDEVLTPDSSRFWPADQYAEGSNPPSFDKQFVRDWLESSGWNKRAPGPELPDAVVAKTAEKYREALVRLAG